MSAIRDRGADGLDPPAPRRRPSAGLVAFNLLGLVGVALLIALGTWQVQRRAWKHALIEQVEARVNAPPVAPPGPAAWPDLDPETYVYRHVRLVGTFLYGQSTLVQAVTERGGGFWVITPFRTQSGFTVLVNRGFVPADRRDPTGWSRPEGTRAVTGLMRATEPEGGFLRTNQPDADRWYSRDVAAIADARGLGTVAPYFVDAQADADAGGLPVPGLTVLRFTDNHLVYALTWFTLALMLLAAILFVDRRALLGGPAERGGTAQP